MRLVSVVRRCDSCDTRSVRCTSPSAPWTSGLPDRCPPAPRRNTSWGCCC